MIDMITFTNIFLTASTWIGAVFVAWILLLFAGAILIAIVVFLANIYGFLRKLWLKFNRWVDA